MAKRMGECSGVSLIIALIPSQGLCLRDLIISLITVSKYHRIGVRLQRMNFGGTQKFSLSVPLPFFYTYPNLPVTALLFIHLLIEQIRHYFVPGDVLGHQTAAVNPTDKVTLLSCGLYFGLGKQTINKQTDTM